VLCSGGVESGVLVAEMARSHAAVHPLYVRSGLAWEAVELEHMRRFLVEVHQPAVQPLVVLEMPVGDLYQNHWSLSGKDVPHAETPDEAVFLPGRNLLLLLKGMLWCHLRDVPALAIGTLQSNPFPDATPSFFAQFEQVVNSGLGSQVRIERPFAQLHKEQVVRLGQGLPWEWTFSCIRPTAERHCGACNKCAERQRAFAEAGVLDPTVYVREV
jgi:7-cyano-7-deazaguanine synthase